jgi:3-oxoacyl-[acyl-carrier protein] reductase
VIAFVLSSSVKSPVSGLAISNGLRPGSRCSPRNSPMSSARPAIRVLGLLPGWIALVADDRQALSAAARGDV